MGAVVESWGAAKKGTWCCLGGRGKPSQTPPLLESVMPQPSDSWDPLGTGQEGRPVQKPGSGSVGGGTKELYPGFIKQAFSHPASSCHSN